jgi:hypothetical protein
MFFVTYLQKTYTFTHFFKIRYFLLIQNKWGNVLRAVKRYCTLLGGKTGGAWGVARSRGKEGLFWGAGYDRQEIPLPPAPHHNSPCQDDRSHWGIQEGGCLGWMLHRGGRDWLSLGC